MKFSFRPNTGTLISLIREWYFSKEEEQSITWWHQLFILKSNVSGLEESRKTILKALFFLKKNKNNEFCMWIFEVLKINNIFKNHTCSISMLIINLIFLKSTNILVCLYQKI